MKSNHIWFLYRKKECIIDIGIWLRYQKSTVDSSKKRCGWQWF